MFKTQLLGFRGTKWLVFIQIKQLYAGVYAERTFYFDTSFVLSLEPLQSKYKTFRRLWNISKNIAIITQVLAYIAYWETGLYTNGIMKQFTLFKLIAASLAFKQTLLYIVLHNIQYSFQYFRFSYWNEE